MDDDSKLHKLIAACIVYVPEFDLTSVDATSPSYFNKSNNDVKGQVMVSKAASLDYLVVNNEVEAIITEANMIKEYKPKYNISLKDDKSFPYIMITNEPYPKVEIIRKKNLHRDGNTYFGPYTDVNYLREVVKVLHRIFPIRTCSYFINKQTIRSYQQLRHSHARK